MKTICLKIDDELYDAIKRNATDIGNSTTYEIKEMLWAALKTRTDDIQKILVERTNVTKEIRDLKQKTILGREKQ